MIAPDYSPLQDAIDANPLLTKQEERDLFAVLRSDAPTETRKAARDRLILANLQMVYAQARRCPRDPDLVPALIVQLIKCVDGFDPARGYAFSTYAVWSLIHFTKDFFNSNKAQRATGLPWSDLDARPVSDPTGEKVRIEEFPDTRAGDASDEIDSRAAPQRLAALMATTLAPRDRMVLGMRFGIDGKEYTLEAIGKALGVTKERIRQIETRAIERLKAAVRARGMSAVA